MPNEIPPEVLHRVRRTVARLDDAVQLRRRAIDDATIVAGTGKGGIDRAYFLRGRRGDLAEIRADRAWLREFVALAIENGVDGEAVVRSVRDALKAERRANPSGRYFECRRVMAGMRAAREATLPALPDVIPSRHARPGYDRRRWDGDSSLPSPGRQSAAEYRRTLAGHLRVERLRAAERRMAEAERQAIAAMLQARGKQTPERVALAKAIQQHRASARVRHLDTPATPALVRRHFLDRKRRRRSSTEASLARLVECLKDAPWFASAGIDGGTMVVRVTDMRAARRLIKGSTEFEGKPLVVERVRRPRQRTSAIEDRGGKRS